MSEVVLDREAGALLRYLNSQREHVLGILEGLENEALHRPVLPSGWTPVGLVHHLTVDVERFWFGAVVAGDQAVIDSFEEWTNPWQVDPSTSAKQVFDGYQREIERANAIIITTPVETAPAWWPEDLFGEFRLETAREIILHVTTETACHAGHLDAVRELTDGRQWLVIDE